MDNNNQPVQPEPVPQQPQAPDAPQPQIPNAQPPIEQPGYQMPPKKGLSKGAIWGIIGGSIGMVVIIITVVLLVVLLGGPSKEDYRKTIDYINDSKLSKGMDLSRIKSGDEAKQKMNSLIKTADEHFDKLRSDKIMRDGEVKRAFDRYEGAWKKAKPIMKEVVDVAVMTYDYRDNCSGGSFVSYINKTGEQVGKDFDSKNGDCIKLLEKLKDSENKSIAEYSKAQYNYLKDMREYYIAMAERYSSKNYSSPSPKYPDYPDAENPGLSIYDKLKDVKVDDYERDFLDILRKKASA